MIKINNNNFNATNYEDLQQKLIHTVLKEIFSHREKAKEFKKKFQSITNKNVYLSELIKDIIMYDPIYNDFSDKYNILAYIQMAFFYIESGNASNVSSRKQFLDDLYIYGVNPGNEAIQKFIPSFQELSDLDKLEGNIRNKDNFSDYINLKLFKEYLEFDAACKSVFDYYKFISPIRSAVIKEMNIKVCPYCNESLIHMVDSDERALADIDHFFMHTKFPLFGLTFSNFIPSCILCNRSLKGQSYVEILNPRNEGFEQFAMFELENPILSNIIEEVKIDMTLKIPSSSKKHALINDSIKLFSLIDRYNHNDVKDTLLRLNRESKRLSKGMLESYRYILDEEEDTKDITFEVVYEHIFGFDVNTNDFINIRYGKLKADIFNKNNFIK